MSHRQTSGLVRVPQVIRRTGRGPPESRSRLATVLRGGMYRKRQIEAMEAGGRSHAQVLLGGVPDCPLSPATHSLS